jgi:L-alanine-DL-glutamate epimerase-like enolase superfamily enzyme
MRISSIRVFPATKPFYISFHSGQASRTTSESIILEVGYDNGMLSSGESAPRAYVTGETLASVAGLIRDSFAPLLLHREVGKLENIESVLQDLEDFCRQRTLKSHLSALGAVDIALLDGLGQLENRPAAAYLGSLRESPPAYSLSVPFLSTEQMHHHFQRLRGHVFKHLKVLVGDDLSWNADRLRTLRTLFGEGIDIRIEVNGKWSFEQAVANTEALKRFGISAVEQPLPAHDIEGLRRYREKTGMRVVADESFCSLSDARRLIESRACDVLNIKLSKCGGLLRSKAIADFAHSTHIPCQLGAHVGETEILTAAGRHFAAVTDLLWIDGGYSFLLFGGGQGQNQPGGRDNEPLGPGLGLHVHHGENTLQDPESL